MDLRYLEPGILIRGFQTKTGITEGLGLKRRHWRYPFSDQDKALDIVSQEVVYI